MQVQPVVRFRGISPGEGLEDEIRRRLAQLRRYYPDIVGCRILLRLSDRHHLVGGRFEVQLDLSVPGRRHLLVSHVANPRGLASDLEHETLRKAQEVDRERRFAMVAVRDAFEVARRRLQDFGRIQRGVPKPRRQAPRT